jgi:hypothetical protein
MNFSVIPSDKFKKEAKRLPEKFLSLKKELSELVALLEIEDIICTIGASLPSFILPAYDSFITNPEN